MDTRQKEGGEEKTETDERVRVTAPLTQEGCNRREKRENRNVASETSLKTGLVFVASSFTSRQARASHSSYFL
jgi:hypothetical protein